MVNPNFGQIVPSEEKIARHIKTFKSLKEYEDIIQMLPLQRVKTETKLFCQKSLGIT